MYIRDWCRGRVEIIEEDCQHTLVTHDVISHIWFNQDRGHFCCSGSCAPMWAMGMVGVQVEESDVMLIGLGLRDQASDKAREKGTRANTSHPCFSSILLPVIVCRTNHWGEKAKSYGVVQIRSCYNGSDALTLK